MPEENKVPRKFPWLVLAFIVSWAIGIVAAVARTNDSQYTQIFSNLGRVVSAIMMFFTAQIIYRRVRYAERMCGCSMLVLAFVTWMACATLMHDIVFSALQESFFSFLNEDESSTFDTISLTLAFAISTLASVVFSRWLCGRGRWAQ